MPWQILLCSCHLTKSVNIWAAWMPQRSSFLLVYWALFPLLWLSLLPSYHKSPCFQWSLYPPVQEIPDHPVLFTGAFCLHMQSANHESRLNASAVKSSNYWNPKQRKSKPLPWASHTAQSVGDGASQPARHKIPISSSLPHNMPSKRGQVETTWIDTDECFWQVLFSCLSLLSVWRQSSVLCYWFGCAGGNRKRRSPRKCYTCRKLSPGVAGWAKGETSLSGRHQVGALQQCWRRKITLARKINKFGVRVTQKHSVMITLHLLFDMDYPKLKL